jgi:hypothetical protein
VGKKDYETEVAFSSSWGEANLGVEHSKIGILKSRSKNYLSRTARELNRILSFMERVGRKVIA